MKRLYALNRHHSEGQQAVEYSTAGAKVWDAWVNSIPEYDDGDPMADGMARAKPHALRLANLYAQLDERRLDGWKMRTRNRSTSRPLLSWWNDHAASMAWYLADQSVGGVNAAFDKGDLDRLRKRWSRRPSRRPGSGDVLRYRNMPRFLPHDHKRSAQRNVPRLWHEPTRAPEGEVVGSGRRRRPCG